MIAKIIPTVIICIVLAAIVALAVISIIRDRKKGKSCSCGCQNCAMSGMCHSAKNKNEENNKVPDTVTEVSEDKTEE